MNFSKQILELKNDIVQGVQNLIRIPSVQQPPLEDKPFGESMSQALCYVLSLAEELGFKVSNLDGYCGYAEYGEGELYIGVFTHVDVYAEESSAWKHDIYGGQLKDGKIYGNGALDKGALIAALYALKVIKDSGIVLNKKIRLVVGTDEGKRYTDIKRYLEEERTPIAGFTVDGFFPVVYAEKGVSMLEYEKNIRQEEAERIEFIKGGVSENIVPGYCSAKLITERKSEIVRLLKKYVMENRRNLSARIVEDGVFVESFGVEFHCMAIEKGINSVSQMLSFLAYIKFGNCQLQETISFLDKSVGFEIYGESLGIATEDDFSGKLTFNIGYFNFEKDRLLMRFECRFPIICNYELTVALIREKMNAAGFKENESKYWNPTYLPRNHFLIETLLAAYRETTKDDSEPIVSSCISYATAMPNVAAFGAIFPGEEECTYRANECIDIENLLRAAEIYAAAIHKLATEL